MTDNAMDKIVENKLLIVVGRVGTALVVMCLPFIFSMFIGFNTSMNNIENRVTIIETKQTSNSTLTTSAQETISAQVEELRKQNIMILQAIARLEVKAEARP